MPPAMERKRPEDAAVHITVSDPVQHSEGMNKYTSYRVDVRGEIGAASPAASSSSTPPSSGTPTHSPSNYFQNPNHTAVLRRYSDFLWLFERLQKERPGAILPPLPEKQAVARFSAAFVEDRRANLELFLRRLSVHPEVSDATCLHTFLRADDTTFHAAKKGSEGGLGDAYSTGYEDDVSYSPSATQAAAFGSPTQKKKKDIKQWFAETKTTALINIGMGENLVHSPDDDLFVEIENYVNSLDAQMKHVLSQSSALVRKGKEIANGMFEFGLAFSLLGQSEAADENAGAASSGGERIGLGAALSKMGSAADGLSVLAAELAESEERRFEHPLKDYIRTIHAVKMALAKRAEKRLTYTTCLSEVQSKQAAADRLGGIPGKEDKAYAANRSLQRAQEAAEAAREDFATVSQRILREVDRFKREKADDMRCTVMDYINLQIEYNERMEQVWAKLIPQLEGIQVGGASDRGSDHASSHGDLDGGGAVESNILGVQ